MFTLNANEFVTLTNEVIESIENAAIKAANDLYNEINEEAYNQFIAEELGYEISEIELDTWFHEQQMKFNAEKKISDYNSILMVLLKVNDEIGLIEFAQEYYLDMMTMPTEELEAIEKSPKAKMMKTMIEVALKAKSNEELPF